MEVSSGLSIPAFGTSTRKVGGPVSPEDVASLVTQIDEGKTRVTLVNVSQVAAREVMVQTGGYGEHLCTRVVVEGRGHADQPALLPGSPQPRVQGAELVIHHRRFANLPTLGLSLAWIPGPGTPELRRHPPEFA